MARAHLFAIDWLPRPTDIATGGGLRSLQILEALRAGGHQVTVSVPLESNRVKQLMRSEPALMKTVCLHDHDNQLDILREVKPDIVLWLWPSLRAIPYEDGILHIVDLNGIQHFEIANGALGMINQAREELVRRCKGAVLALTGSAEQNGFWLAELARGAPEVPTAIVPYTLPSVLRQAGAGGLAGLRRLHFTGNLHSWNPAVSWLQHVAAWCDRRGGVTLDLVAGIDPGGATRPEVIHALTALERFSCVRLVNEAPLQSLLGGYGPGSVALDLYDNTLERMLAVPVRTVNALLHGVPVVSNIASTLMRGLERRGAAVLVGEALEPALDQLAALSPEAMGAMSIASRNAGVEYFNQTDSTHILLNAIDVAMRHRTAANSKKGRRETQTPRPHVLVISDEPANLRHVRVEVPFGALYRQGLIGGFSQFRNGRIESSTRGHQHDPQFDVIWVQRRLAPEMSLALQSLERPFVLDMDDNTLVSPAYREAFPTELIQASRFLVRECAVLATSTPRLAALIQRHAQMTLIDKAVVCQNLAEYGRDEMAPAEPGCVVWASSDTPALVSEASAVTRAIRDFCLAANLRLICVGAAPHPLLLESEVELEHVGLLAYPAYQSLLRSCAPGIVVCPLEIGGTGATRDFIDGKSDIKILETMSAGLTGVFSAAKPYLESDLPAPILCENDYRSWFNALMRARDQCRHGLRPAMPAHRLASGAGLQTWGQAVLRGQMQSPLALSQIQAALGMTASRFRRRLVTREDFDPAWYIARNPDVHSELAKDDFEGAYNHYLSYGYRERRAGNSDDVIMEAGHSQFWANITHTLSDLRQSVENRRPEIEEMRARRAKRQSRRPQMP